MKNTPNLTTAIENSIGYHNHSNPKRKWNKTHPYQKVRSKMLLSAHAMIFYISSVQFSHTGMSDFLQTHTLQHARLPCPSPTPRACLKSCLLSWWCHLTISSSGIPFSSCLQSFPASGFFFQMSQHFASDGHSIEASASVFPINIQD